MRVSVIVPSYNQAQFIQRTLESILKQDYGDIELLVYDGGSSDGTLDILRRYEESFDHFESGPDGGQSAAINKGFRRVTGDIVTWLNSDDVLTEGALSAVVHKFRSEPRVDAVYGDFDYIDANDNFLRHRHVFRKFRYETLLFHDYLGQPAVFYRREVLDRIGLLDEGLDYSMDWDFFLRMKRECTMAHLRRTLAGYRLHADAKSSQEGDEEYARCLDVIFERNKRSLFGVAVLDRLYYSVWRWVSRFQRLWVVLRDNPLHYWRAYRYSAADSWWNALRWRWRH